MLHVQVIAELRSAANWAPAIVFHILEGLEHTSILSDLWIRLKGRHVEHALQLWA